MRYTRYNHNRRRGGGNGGKGTFLASLVGVVLVAIVLGILVGKVIFNDGIAPFTPNNDKETNAKPSNDTNENKKPEDNNNGAVENMEVYYLQCGVFSTQENATLTLGKLPSGVKGFVSEEDEKFKVLVGVFTTDMVEGKSNELKSAGVDNIKIKIPLETKTNDDKIKVQILDGYIKILSKLNEKDVKSYETKEFKEWLTTNTANVKIEDKDVNSLIENVKSLPEEITKDNGVEINKFIYDIVKKSKI